MEEKRRDSAPVAATGGGADLPASAEPPSSSRRRAGGQKRKFGSGGGGLGSAGSSSSSAPSKRANREKSSLLSHSHPLIPIHNNHNGPLTRARQGPTAALSLPPSPANSFSVKPSPKPIEAAAAEAARRKENELEAIEAAIEAKFHSVRSRSSTAHVVPNHCGWFSWTKIHPVEEHTLVSFFNGKSELRTAETYLDIRNWIMRKFHSNPNMQIELKDLSELEVADLDARQEVLEFLDYWGLINFHPFPQSASAMDCADGDNAVETVSLADKLYQFETPQSSKHVVPKNSLTAPSVPSGLFPESAIIEDLMRPEGPSVEYHCNSCSADCSRKRYHCQKQADFDLCYDCFSNKKFDSGMSSSDFILMEPGDVPGLNGGMWTDQETLLLLEALELYKENWSEIAEHVATKTKAQCILHFVQMPIEDGFLDLDDDIDSNAKETANPSPAEKDSPTPKDAAQESESVSVTAAKENQSPTSPKETTNEEMKEEKSSQGTSKPDDTIDTKASQETSKPEETIDTKASQETPKPEEESESKDTEDPEEDCGMKALKEAFEAVGYPLTPDGPLSFAEVGNPVMTLAAFLSNLVGPDLATASAHNSLKSLSASTPGIELATRHCFILEDPPNETKELAELPSNAEAANEEAQEEEAHDQETQKVDSPADTSDNKSQDSTLEENKPPGTPEDEHSEKPIGEEAGPTNVDKSETTDTNKDQLPPAVSESEDKKAEEEHPPFPEKNTEQKSGEPLESTETVKDVEMSEPQVPEHADAATDDPLLAKEECQQPENASSAEEKPSETATDVEMVPRESEKNEPLQQVSDNATFENRTTDDETKESDKENLEPIETKEDKTDKLKRVAVTAISAAAVKAKLLAGQEEDQIRQLATLLIEKQLQKLEYKLTFFNEMESLVMRVREQLDRSRQKLYHERAQIIAARLGISASSSRMAPSSMPANRIGMNVAGQSPRPPLGMISQRPPMPRPPMATMSPTTPSMPLSSSPGSSIRPSGPEKLSSVGTK